MSRSWRRQWIARLGLALSGAGPRASASATERPVRLILQVERGAPVDVAVRTLCVALARALGRQVQVDNQPGAGGLVGAAALARAKPDGLTFGVVSNSHLIQPSLMPRLPFDVLADFTPISVLGIMPLLLVVNPAGTPAGHVRELIAWLRARPRRCRFASPGHGTIPHLAAQMFADAAGLRACDLCSRGSAPMVAGLIEGHADFGVLALPVALPHLRQGTLRAIGVGSTGRIAALPQMPTIAEQGMPGFHAEGWFAAVGPGGMPAGDVSRIHAAFVSALAVPQVRDALVRQGNLIAPGAPEAAAPHFRDEFDRYARLVQRAGTKID